MANLKMILTDLLSEGLSLEKLNQPLFPSGTSDKLHWAKGKSKYLLINKSLKFVDNPV